MIQLDHPLFTAAVTPEPLDHITQCQIQTPLKHLQGW